MGSGGSKACGCSDVPSSSENNPVACDIIRKVRSRGSKILFPSCLRPHPRRLCDIQRSGHGYRENGADALSREQSRVVSNQVDAGCDVKDNVVKPYDLPRVSSISELDEWNEATLQNTASGAGSSSARNSSDQPLNPSSRFLSRLSFIPGNISFRLNRASSIGSSRAYPLSSTNLTTSGNEEEFNVGMQSTSCLFVEDETRQGSRSRSLSACMNSTSPRQHCGDAFDNLGPNIPPYHYRDGHMRSNDIIARSGVNGTTGGVANLHLARNLSEVEIMDSRRADRRTAAREPIENNVHFSRTLSVGRLRDRVLRRSTISDLSAFPLRQEREETDASQNSRGGRWGAERSPLMRPNIAVQPTFSGNLLLHTSGGSSNQSYDLEVSRPRETRYHDLLEHRSNFLERRRRIRSQVRALQRLGNRFENLSGHERSCILSGQHRSGRCSCRIRSRDGIQNDDASARASISRIVMLAEALFEVLDEIHQQSVVLSSRPSISAIGSIPAPVEVVDALPMKLYSKLQKQQIEDASQCYICLLEYEEGDNIRVLPCHHEFHKTCIDKWLKEIHRVCPLCRGDVCRPDSLPSES